MRMHGLFHLLDSSLEMATDYEFGYKLGRVRPHYVRTENLRVLRDADDFHKSFRVPRSDRATNTNPRKLSDFYVMACRFGLFLGQSHRRHLGVAVRAVRHIIVVYSAMALARDMLDAHDTLMRSLVRKELMACNVSDRIYAGDIGP